MSGTFSRLIIIQAAVACLLPLSSWAKMSNCEVWLVPGRTTEDRPKYVAATIGFTVSEKSGNPKGLLIPIPEYQGSIDQNAQNTLLWMIRGTTNLDSLPHDRKLVDEGHIKLAFPVERKNGSTYKIEFIYEQSNPKSGGYIGVLNKVRILDEVSFKVEVKPESKDGLELETLVGNIAHGPRDLIYGFEIDDQILPFKSHLSVSDLAAYKDFFKNFFEYDTYVFGKDRVLQDLDNISTPRDLEKTSRKLALSNQLNWYKDRLHKIATTLVVVAAASSASALTTYWYQHSQLVPKEVVINGLYHPTHGEIKMFGVANPGGGNQFRVGADDEVRLKNESTVKLKDKDGKEVIFSVNKSSKGHLRLELLNPQTPQPN